MEWIPAVSATSLFAAALWLSRNLIATRLTNSVRHEYDTKLERLKADLNAKASQIDALRSGVLSAVTAREAAIFQRHLTAIEQLWSAVISLGPAKSVSAWMAIVKFEAAATEAAKNPRFREFFSMIGGIDLNSLSTDQALRTRPFVSPLAWAYYSAYQAIVVHAVARLHMLKNGIDMVEVIDTKNVTELVKVALPHQVQYIEEHGPSAFHYLLEELESNLLAAFELMLKGDDSDQATLNKAADIIKKSETLMDSNVTPGPIR
ncbi:hypothetical protein P3T40_002015 [Paraburkholderia sp. EB58]|jgi:hypothetical protein|uniref:hypothetical protein n=1 Tax=Paraburkholderia sp. EB58 TaxID=3035125 RepID=UPI003D236EA3